VQIVSGWPAPMTDLVILRVFRRVLRTFLYASFSFFAGGKFELTNTRVCEHYIAESLYSQNIFI